MRVASLDRDGRLHRTPRASKPTRRGPAAFPLMEVDAMSSRVERISKRFIELMQLHGAPHVKRLGPSVGPLLWKIAQLPGVEWVERRTRQVKFIYGGWTFKARFSHRNGGQLEIVQMLGTADGDVVAEICGLDAAMTVDLECVLNEFLVTPQPALAV